MLVVVVVVVYEIALFVVGSLLAIEFALACNEMLRLR